jgi:AAA domain
LTNPFTPDQVRKYFENRLPGQSLRGTQNTLKCAFHDDKMASMSVNLEKGLWRCHAGCGGGGLVHFEKLFSECSEGEAWVNVCEITGHSIGGSGRPEFIWVYTDEGGTPLSRKIRYPKDENGKKQIKWERFESGHWVGGSGCLAGVRKVLYNLPKVVTANVVMIFEGEKCADIGDGIRLYADRPDLRVACTTAPDGADSWKDEYGEWLTGRVVLVFPDQNKEGKRYARDAAESAYRHHAHLTKVIELPGMGEKDDIEQYIAAHPQVSDLLAEIKKAKPYEPLKVESGADKFFVPAMRLAVTVPDQIDWMIEKVAPRGWNGFVIADPKSLKSYSTLDMLIHLSLGKNWMGFNVPRSFRTAMLAREDYWGLTAWRIKHFTRGMVRDEKITAAEIDYLERDGMFVNTQAQEETWYLDNDADVTDLIRRLKERKVEFLAMDVFRVLFMGDESDNTEMQQVLDRVKRIRAEVGCGICIVHHARKDGTGDIFQRARGASAIHGFMEFGIGITTENPDDERSAWIRKMEFLTKAGDSPAPIYIRAEGGEQEGFIRLARTDYTKPKRRTKPADIVASLPYKGDD